MTQPTKKERRVRLDVVEETMAKVGWNPRIVRDLADRFGVTERTIYNYRRDVLEELAECYRGENRRQDRAEFVAMLRERQVKAMGEGSWGSVSSMMGIEAKVMGLEDSSAAGASETVVVVRPKVDV